jgi:hypothetical protein
VTSERNKVVVTQHVTHVGVSEEVTTVLVVGVQGLPGASASHYEHPFTNQLSVTVDHNLGYKPAVTVIDSAGDEVECDVTHESANQAILNFSASFSGVALFN